MNDIKLKTEELHSYYKNYVDKRADNDIIKGLRIDKEKCILFMDHIPVQKWQYAYQKGKWTIAEVFSHIIDTERIFSYRALRFARNDKTPLAGFDQDLYVPASYANNTTLEEMKSDFLAARNNSIALFSSFSDDLLLQIGTASQSTMSVRAIGYILSGHQNHHLAVLNERYL